MSLADYLAKNYLNADASYEKKGKKRKRKAAADVAGLTIADDDALGWTANAAANDEDDAPPITITGRSADFRKAKSNNWKSVGVAAPTNAEQAAADAIIASAAAENQARRDAEDEAPDVVDEENVLTMESGARAGLQTAGQVAAAVRRHEKEERRKFEETAKESSMQGQETIYRDASGRIINVAMKRAEARKKAEEEERKRVEEQEAQKGDVQRAQREERKQALGEAKYMTVARYADDEARNAELKEQDRWNDPAAQFLTKKKAGKSRSGKPLYQGAAPPNRYGIRPGHRWDGVDRSNGFEQEYFAAQNKRRNLKDLEYAWQMDE